MSEIDKLIGKAFPDELRDVEPIAVDEDAILKMTLDTLGLKPSPKPGLPEPGALRRQRGTAGEDSKPEPEFVEVPVVVHHRWVDWAGWAIAACLVLVLAVNWGPWFINNLDFGLGPRSPGGVSSRKEGSASENGQWVMQNVLGASVEEFSADYGEDGTVTFRLRIEPVGSSQEIDLDKFDIQLEGKDGERLDRVIRSSSGNEVSLTYEMGRDVGLVMTLQQPVPLKDSSTGMNIGYAYGVIDKLNIDISTGMAYSVLKNGSFRFESYYEWQEAQ